MKVPVRARKIAKAVFPAGSRRRIIAGRIKQIILGTNRRKYHKWIKKYEAYSFAETLSKLDASTYAPMISIIVPCYNTPRRYLDELLASVRGQLYTNWQLCIADGSTDQKRSEYIAASCKGDDKIAYIRLENNQGIIGNTNNGLKLAKGQFIAFMDHDDTLSPYALAEVVILLNEHKEADLIYSDEDKLTDNGNKRVQPFFKPDWSPEFLRGINYITHFVVARRSLVVKLGGLREGFEGAQDYDFLLRFTEITQRIHHIPKILYHWRLAAGSTARQVSEKDYASDAGLKALAEAVERQKIKAEAVAVTDRPTNYRLRYTVPPKAKVSIIIPFKDKVEYLKKLMPSILDCPENIEYEIILISNNSVEKETHEYLKKVGTLSRRIKVYAYDKTFNFSAINNYGRTKATGDYLIFLNNDTEVITKNWIEELVGVAAQPQVGAVGPLLLYPDERIQHAGVVVGMKTMAGHVFRLRRKNDITEFGIPSWPRNYLAVTGACLVVSARKFDAVGGFDESMIVAGSDVALCISLYEKGFLNVYWPFAQLYHYESVSVVTYDNGIIGDYNRSLEYYAPYLNYKDPYFNSNLDIMNETIGLRTKYE